MMKDSDYLATGRFKTIKNFYYVYTFPALLRAIWSDLLATIFLLSGSGLVTSVVKGFLGHIIIKSGYPLFIGKRTKLINIHNITLGRNVRIGDDVSIIAYGKIVLGDNVIIGDKTTLFANKLLSLGDNVVVTRGCYIAQLGGEIKIDNNTLIGDMTRIHSINHSYDVKNVSLASQRHIRNTIHIKENAWIGSGVMVINNVTIGERAVIGANAVVNKDIPDFVVAVGVPAKVIKKINAK